MGASGWAPVGGRMGECLPPARPWLLAESNDLRQRLPGPGGGQPSAEVGFNRTSRTPRALLPNTLSTARSRLADQPLNAAAGVAIASKHPGPNIAYQSNEQTLRCSGTLYSA